MERRPDKIQTQYIDWIKEFEDMYSAWNKSGEKLGILKYERTGRFKHWCWYQEQDIRMSPGCLQAVRDIQKELVRNHEK